MNASAKSEILRVIGGFMGNVSQWDVYQFWGCGLVFICLGLGSLAFLFGTTLIIEAVK